MPESSKEVEAGGARQRWKGETLVPFQVIRDAHPCWSPTRCSYFWLVSLPSYSYAKDKPNGFASDNTAGKYPGREDCFLQRSNHVIGDSFWGLPDKVESQNDEVCAKVHCVDVTGTDPASVRLDAYVAGLMHQVRPCELLLQPKVLGQLLSQLIQQVIVPPGSLDPIPVVLQPLPNFSCQQETKFPMQQGEDWVCNKSLPFMRARTFGNRL